MTRLNDNLSTKDTCGHCSLSIVQCNQITSPKERQLRRSLLKISLSFSGKTASWLVVTSDSGHDISVSLSFGNIINIMCPLQVMSLFNFGDIFVAQQDSLWCCRALLYRNQSVFKQCGPSFSLFYYFYSLQTLLVYSFFS